MQGHESQILERDLVAIQTAAVAKAMCKKLQSIVAQKGGVVTAESVWYKRIQREEDVRQKAETTLFLAQRALEREEIKAEAPLRKLYKQLEKDVRAWKKTRNDLHKKQKHIDGEIKKFIAFRI